MGGTIGRLKDKARTKSTGFLGPLRIKSGPEGAGVATEFAIPMYESGSPGDPGYEKGPEMPTLVPTLTEEERRVMVNDVIPNRRGIPGPVYEKALLHAKQRQAMGLSPFFDANVERRNRRQRRSFDFR